LLTPATTIKTAATRLATAAGVVARMTIEVSVPARVPAGVGPDADAACGFPVKSASDAETEVPPSYFSERKRWRTADAGPGSGWEPVRRERSKEACDGRFCRTETGCIG
jgi:hypothetical protein